MLKEFHASHHRGDPLRLGQLVEADRAEARVPDQALLLQFGQRLELPCERAEPPGGHRSGGGPEVDYVEHVEPEPAEVVVYLLAQRLR
jgi:hypothetical protein